MSLKPAIHMVFGSLGGLLLLIGACSAWVHWPSQVLSAKSPDNAFQLVISKRTLLPANSWLEPRAACVVKLKSLGKHSALWSRPLTADFVIYEAETVILAEEGPDCHWTTVHWSPDNRSVQVELRGEKAVTLSLAPEPLR